MQAYGWSLPAKFQPQIPNAASTRSSVSVPVPIYCRPLLEADQGLKVGFCKCSFHLKVIRVVLINVYPNGFVY